MMATMLPTTVPCRYCSTIVANSFGLPTIYRLNSTASESGVPQWIATPTIQESDTELCLVMLTPMVNCASGALTVVP